MTSGNRYVALSTNLAPSYSMLAPMTVALWSRLGFKSIVGLEQFDNRPRAKLISDTLEAQGALLRPLPHLHGWNDACPAQVCRLFLWTEIEEDDVMLTADVDMLPIPRPHVRTYFDQFDRRLATSYDKPSKGAMSCAWYVGGSKASWRTLMGHGYTSTNIHDIMLEHTRSTQWEGNIQHDQGILGEAFARCGEHVFRHTGEHHPDRSRIHRERWPADLAGAVERAYDAHLARDSHTEPEWPNVRALLTLVAPDLVAWAEKYRVNFLALLAQEPAYPGLKVARPHQASE